MDYAALNPAERRALNIQRQEAFFRENHGHRAETLVDEGREEKVSEEIVFSKEGGKVDSNIASSSLASLVCRESEVSQIHSFIQRVRRTRVLLHLFTFFRYNAQDYGLHDVLLVTAASGTGKTRLIQHALQICKGVAHAYVLCSGFSAPKQLVRCVWMAIESLAAREGSAAAHSYPSSYEDLVKNASSMRFSSTAVLVLDRIDCADDLLPGLSEKLMLLPEVELYLFPSFQAARDRCIFILLARREYKVEDNWSCLPSHLCRHEGSLLAP